MQACKFLDAGRSPFTGWRWELPAAGRPARWLEVSGPPVLCGNGLHARSLAQLAPWMTAEMSSSPARSSRSWLTCGNAYGPLPTSHRIGRSPHYHQAFHDVTTRDNTMTVTSTSGPVTVAGCRAAPGWDPVTGWGTPDARVLVPLLAGRSAAPRAVAAPGPAWSRRATGTSTTTRRVTGEVAQQR